MHAGKLGESELKFIEIQQGAIWNAHAPTIEIISLYIGEVLSEYYVFSIEIMRLNLGHNKIVSHKRVSMMFSISFGKIEGRIQLRQI